jgi:Zn-finger nucleic acid-binding protein
MRRVFTMDLQLNGAEVLGISVKMCPKCEKVGITRDSVGMIKKTVGINTFKVGIGHLKVGINFKCSYK